eukprot:TRINITY_DN12188_c0_g2_i1.p1 TRINITY_DN12188_c0_g2~~TRINITY_DN12188_c0_g2_i1.p1  ORF type:complete len:316 (+),score=59.79 TRINITY_DN12188_c0_g2_i1:53-1000(+)
MYYCLKGCSTVCDGMSDCCGACLFPEDHPSTVFLTFGTVVNLAIASVGLGRILGGVTSTGCDEPVKVMTYAAVGAAAGHILFCLYFWKRLDIAMHKGNDTDAEAMRMVKYDPGVFVYILFSIGNAVAFIISMTQKNEEDSCTALAATSFYLWLFLFLYVLFLGIVACLAASTSSAWSSITRSGYQPAASSRGRGQNTTTTTTTTVFVSSLNPFQIFFGSPKTSTGRPAQQPAVAPSVPPPVCYQSIPPSGGHAQPATASLCPVPPPSGPPASCVVPQPPAPKRVEQPVVQPAPSAPPAADASNSGWQGAAQQPQW